MTFSADNLEVSITLNGKTVTWKPTPAVNTTLNGNLLGTIRVSYFLLYLCICMGSLISSSVFATRKFNKTILTKSHMVNIVGKCCDRGAHKDGNPFTAKTSWLF